MEIKLSERKKKDSATETMTLPVGLALKERYKRVQREMEERKFESLHEFTRAEISRLLDEIESQLSGAI